MKLGGCPPLKVKLKGKESQMGLGVQELGVVALRGWDPDQANNPLMLGPGKAVGWMEVMESKAESKGMSHLRAWVMKANFQATGLLEGKSKESSEQCIGSSYAIYRSQKPSAHSSVSWVGKEGEQELPLNWTFSDTKIHSGIMSSVIKMSYMYIKHFCSQ